MSVLYCECLRWARADENNEIPIKIPLSNHHPKCSEYHAKEYSYIVELGLVCDHGEVAEMTDEMESPAVKTIKLTEDQYSNLRSLKDD